MPRHPTASDVRQTLAEHVIAKGAEIFAQYGPRPGLTGLLRLLWDRAQVRYPCELIFDAGPLMPGEFAHPAPKGERPEEGFTMFVHPLFQPEPALVPALVLYHLVAVNYGPFASADDAENFGATALGLTRDEYYALLCAAADRVEAAAGATGFSSDG